MQEYSKSPDEVMAERATKLLKDKKTNPREYALGAIQCLKDQLLTSRSETRKTKLAMAIRRWELVLAESSEQKF